MWTKFDNSSISMRELITVSIWLGFYQKNHFFEGWSWFKFNNLGVALGMALKFCTIVAKQLKLKVGTFLWLIPTFVEVTGKKLVRTDFLSPTPLPSEIRLKFDLRFRGKFIFFNIFEKLILARISRKLYNNCSEQAVSKISDSTMWIQTNQSNLHTFKI